MSDLPEAPLPSAKPNLKNIIQTPTAEVNAEHEYMPRGKGKGMLSEDKGVKLKNIFNSPEEQARIKEQHFPTAKAPETKIEARAAEAKVEANKVADKVADVLEEKTGEEVVNNEDGTLTITIDGVDEVITLTEAKKLAQMGKVAIKKMAEASDMKKESETKLAQINELIQMLKQPATAKELLSDPRLGLDRKALAEMILMEQYQDEQDPVGAENRRLKAQLEQREKFEAAEKAKIDADSQAEKVAAATADWKARIDSTLTAQGMLGENEQANAMIRGQMAHYLQMGINEGIQLSPEDVFDQVKTDYQHYVMTTMQNLSMEQLEKVVPEAFLNKVRDLNLSKLKGQEVAKKVAAPAKKAAPVKEKPVKRDTVSVKNKEGFKSQGQTFKEWLAENKKNNS